MAAILFLGASRHRSKIGEKHVKEIFAIALVSSTIVGATVPTAWAVGVAAVGVTHLGHQLFKSVAFRQQLSRFCIGLATPYCIVA